MGQQLSKNGLSTEAIEAIMLKAGKMKSLAPKSVLVQQGAVLRSIFFVVSGELVVCKEGEGSVLTTVVGRRGRGAVIGEMSFLLESPSSASVMVPADATRAATVIEVDHKQAIALLKTDPRASAKIFHMVACILASRIADASDARACTAIVQRSAGQRPIDVGDTGPSTVQEEDGGPSPVHPDTFGLDDDDGRVFFLMQSPCTSFVEDTRDRLQAAGASANHHEHEHKYLPSTLVLFTSAICLRVTAMNFNTQVVVPFKDVLGISTELEHDGTTVLQVNCRGNTLHLNIEPQSAFAAAAHEIERARLATFDTSHAVTERHTSVFETPSHDGRVSEVILEASQAHADRMTRTTRASVTDASRAYAETIKALMGRLSAEEWSMIMEGADRLHFSKGQPIIKEGEATKAIHQIVHGTARVEMRIKGRPTALIVARKKTGDIFGERSLLLGGSANASVVMDSEEGTVLRLKQSHLQKLLDTSHPELPGKFYFFLSLDQAKRLTAITGDANGDGTEVVVTHNTTAPTSFEQLAANPACFVVFEHFVANMKAQGNKKASARIAFIAQHRSLLDADDDDALHAAKLLLQFCAKRGLLTKKNREQIEAKLREEDGHQRPDAKLIRGLFDGTRKTAVKGLETDCLPAFLASHQYAYVLTNLIKQNATAEVAHFKAVRVLAEGRFGQVVEVSKRDCGVHYVMKCYERSKLERAYGPEHWADKIIEHRKLFATVHHPLLMCNLAYAFCTPTFLALIVSPPCEANLSLIVHMEGGVSEEQLHFICHVVVSILAHLHSRRVILRNLASENLLVDHNGRVLLGEMHDAAIGQSADRMLFTDVVGTPGYMAPEMLVCKLTPEEQVEHTQVLRDGRFARNATGAYAYGTSCDWWGFGVLVYELTSHSLPFGEDPSFESIHAGHKALIGSLVSGQSGKNHSSRGLIHDLLHWQPDHRLGYNDHGAAKVLAHKYFTDGDRNGAYDINTKSPLKKLKWWKAAYKHSGTAGSLHTKRHRRSVHTTLDGEHAKALASTGSATPLVEPSTEKSHGPHGHKQGAAKSAMAKKLPAEMNAIAKKAKEGAPKGIKGKQATFRAKKGDLEALREVWNYTSVDAVAEEFVANMSSLAHAAAM
jgi:CRP-like cAMP-binding protein/serine/threonine protein kinase